MKQQDDMPFVRRVDPEKAKEGADSLRDTSSLGEKASSLGEKAKGKSGGKGKLSSLFSKEADKAKNKAKEETDSLLKGKNKDAKKGFSPQKAMKKMKRAAKTADLAAKGGLLAQAINMGKSMMMLMMNLINTAASAVSGALSGLVALLQAIVQFVSGVIAGVGSFISGAISFVGGLLSVGATAATTIVATAVTLVVVVPVLIVSSIIANSSADPSQWDTNLIDCAEQYKETTEMLEGDLNAIQLKHAQMVYSIYKAYGLNNNQIAGMLGNWSVESGIDPTGLEGIYDEPYRIGPKKAAALADHHNYTDNLLAHYKISINRNQYISTNDGTLWMGLGMPQFTSGDRIVVPAEKLGQKWYDMDFQMAFILATGTTSTTGAKGGKNFFNTYKKETASMSPADCAQYFLRYYEGVAGDVNRAHRWSAAARWASEMETWAVDQAYADSVFAMAEKLGALASDGVANAAKEKCQKIGKYDNSSIANAAAAFSWPTQDAGNHNNGTPLFQKVYTDVWGGINLTARWMQNCASCVSTAVRWSGSDLTYPPYSTTAQLEYLSTSPKWQKVGMMGTLSKKDFQPGDVAVLSGHTWVYVGEKAIQKVHGKENPSDSVSASLLERSPGAGRDLEYYLGSNGIDTYHHLEYHVFRLVKPDKSNKYSQAGEGVSPTK